MNYRIVCNTPVIDNGDTVYRDYTLFDLTQEGRELNKAILTRGFNGNFHDAQLVFTIHPGHPCYNSIILSLSTITVYDEVNGDYVEIFRGRPISCSIDKVLMKTYTCEYMMKFLIDVPDFFSTIDDDGDVDIPTAIDAVIDGYNDYAADNRKIYAPTIPMTGKASATKGASVYSNLSSWLITAGYYAKIVHNTEDNNDRYELSFSQTMGENRDDLRVVFGENILNYIETVNLNKLYTAVYPVGVDSGDKTFRIDLTDGISGITQQTGYSIDQSSTPKNLIYHDNTKTEFGVVILYAEIDLSDDRNKTEAQQRQIVYDKAVQELKIANGAKNTFSISAVDPRLVGMGGGVAEEGCAYPVIIPPFGLDEGDNNYQVLTKIVTNMTKPSSGSFAFGGDANLLTDQSANSIIAAQRAAADAKSAVAISKNAINKAVQPFSIDATITSTTLTSTKTVGEFINAVNAGKTLLVADGTTTYNVVGSYSGYTCTIAIPDTGNVYTGTGTAATDALVLTKV